MSEIKKKQSLMQSQQEMEKKLKGSIKSAILSVKELAPDWMEVLEEEISNDSQPRLNRTHRVHRIVLEGILTDPSEEDENIDRSLSIPFSGKIRPVWAPNGYGKTFAFKILSLLNNARLDTDAGNFPTNFFESCLALLNPPEEVDGIFHVGGRLSKFLSDDEKKFTSDLIPFSKMTIRLVNYNNTEVVDVEMTPRWSVNPITSLIKRKFWNINSLKTPFFNKYPDSELEEILKQKSSSTHDQIIEPVFLKNSFILPSGRLILKTDTFESVVTKKIFSQEVRFFMKHLIEESGYYNDKYNISFNNSELTVFKDVLQWMKNQDLYLFTNDLSLEQEEYNSHLKVAEELLLELFEFSKKYQNIYLNEHPYYHYRNEIDESKILYEGKDRLFEYIFALFDAYIHDYNSNTASSHNHLPWRPISVGIFTSLYNDSWTYNEFDDTEIPTNTRLHFIWSDKVLLDAIKNLNISYFEIPNIINYSSKEKLQKSQMHMSTILKSISQRVATNQLGGTDLNERNQSYRRKYYDLLYYIKEGLGGRFDTLDSFFHLVLPKDEHIDWHRTLWKLSEEFDPAEDTEMPFDDSNPFMVPDLFGPHYAFVVDEILIFVEIFRNINQSLNSKDAEHWAASCRFNTLGMPMKFKDPKINYDIESRHLSFGQCSVVALEVCIGLGLFEQAHINYRDRPQQTLAEAVVSDGISKWNRAGSSLIFGGYPYNIQTCIILDEPEIGRSEYWLNKVSERIIETLEDLEEPNSGDIFNTSFTIVSHRESLLKSLSRSGNYHVMQPLGTEDNHYLEFGEEE